MAPAPILIPNRLVPKLEPCETDSADYRDTKHVIRQGLIFLVPRIAIDFQEPLFDFAAIALDAAAELERAQLAQEANAQEKTRLNNDRLLIQSESKTLAWDKARLLEKENDFLKKENAAQLEQKAWYQGEVNRLQTEESEVVRRLEPIFAAIQSIEKAVDSVPSKIRQDTSAIKDGLKPILASVTAIDGRTQSMDRGVTAIDGRTQSMQKGAESVPSKIWEVTSVIKDDLKPILTSVTAIDGRTQSMDTVLQSLPSKIQEATSSVEQGLNPIVTGLTVISNHTKSIKNVFESVPTKIQEATSAVEQALNPILTGVVAIDSRTQSMQQVVESVPLDLVIVASRLQGIEGDVATTKETISSVKKDVQSIETKVTSLDNATAAIGNDVAITKNATAAIGNDTHATKQSVESLKEKMTSFRKEAPNAAVVVPDGTVPVRGAPGAAAGTGLVRDATAAIGNDTHATKQSVESLKEKTTSFRKEAPNAAVVVPDGTVPVRGAPGAAAGTGLVRDGAATARAPLTTGADLVTDGAATAGARPAITSSGPTTPPQSAPRSTGARSAREKRQPSSSATTQESDPVPKKRTATAAGFAPLRDAIKKMKPKPTAIETKNEILKNMRVQLNGDTVPVETVPGALSEAIAKRMEQYTGKKSITNGEWRTGCLVSKAYNTRPLHNVDGSEKSGIYACKECVAKKAPCVWQTEQSLLLLPLPTEARPAGVREGEAAMYFFDA